MAQKFQEAWDAELEEHPDGNGVHLGVGGRNINGWQTDAIGEMMWHCLNELHPEDARLIWPDDSYLGRDEAYEAIDEETGKKLIKHRGVVNPIFKRIKEVADINRLDLQFKDVELTLVGDNGEYNLKFKQIYASELCTRQVAYSKVSGLIQNHLVT